MCPVYVYNKYLAEDCVYLFAIVIFTHNTNLFERTTPQKYTYRHDSDKIYKAPIYKRFRILLKSKGNDQAWEN